MKVCICGPFEFLLLISPNANDMFRSVVDLRSKFESSEARVVGAATQRSVV